MTKKSKPKRKRFWMQSMILSLFILGISCQKNNAPQDEDSGKLKEFVGLLDKDLSLMIPVTREELKNWIPIRVGDFKIIRTVIGYKESVDMSAVKATYSHQLDSSKQIVLEILDGAGPVASVLLSGNIQKLNLDFEELKADGFSRIQDRSGQRVWESESSSAGVAEIEFIHAERFLVSIKGKYLRIEDLWIFSDKLDFNRLK